MELIKELEKVLSANSVEDVADMEVTESDLFEVLMSRCPPSVLY